MSRDFAFRVWDVENEVMVYDVGIEMMGVAYICPPEAYEPEQMDYYPDGVVMQYTGLRDKHGERIFEGDILRFLLPKERVIEVSWYDVEAAYIFGMLSGRYSDKEVIGNIYEKPELLKEAND